MATLQNSTSRVVIPWSKHDAALLRAVEKEKLRKVEKLIIKKGVDPSKLSPVTNNTAAHRSVEKGSCDVFYFIISHVTNMNCVNGEGKTLLHTACTFGRDEILTKLLTCSNLSFTAVDGDGLTALHLACSLGHLGCVRQLGSRIHPDVVDKNGWTPLFYAAARGSASVCRILLDCGADVNATDSAKRTPLMTSVGHRATFEFLLSRGADLTATDYDGQTAELYAVRSKGEETLKFLADRKNGKLSGSGSQRSLREMESASASSVQETEIIYSKPHQNRQSANIEQEILNTQQDDQVRADAVGKGRFDQTSNHSTSSSSSTQPSVQEQKEDTDFRRSSSSSGSTAVNEEMRETAAPASSPGRGLESDTGSASRDDLIQNDDNDDDDDDDDFPPPPLSHDKDFSKTVKDLNTLKTIGGSISNKESSKKSPPLDHKQDRTRSDSDRICGDFEQTFETKKRHSLPADDHRHSVSDQIRRELKHMKNSYDVQLQQAESKLYTSSTEGIPNRLRRFSEQNAKIGENDQDATTYQSTDCIYDLKYENKQLLKRLREVEMKYEDADDKIRNIEKKQRALEDISSRKSSTASSLRRDECISPQDFFTIKHLSKRIEQLETENLRLKDWRNTESDSSPHRHSERNCRERQSGAGTYSATCGEEVNLERTLTLCDHCHTRKGRQKSGRRRTESERKYARKCNSKDIEENDGSWTTSSSDSFTKSDARRRYPRTEDRSETRQKNRKTSRKGSQRSEKHEDKYNSRNNAVWTAEGKYLDAQGSSACLLVDSELELYQSQISRKQEISSKDNLVKYNLIDRKSSPNLRRDMEVKRSDKPAYSAMSSGTDSSIIVDEDIMLSDKNITDNENSENIGIPFSMRSFDKINSKRNIIRSGVITKGDREAAVELVSTGVNTDDSPENNSERNTSLGAYDHSYIRGLEEEIRNLKQKLPVTSEESKRNSSTRIDDKISDYQNVSASSRNDENVPGISANDNNESGVRTELGAVRKVDMLITGERSRVVQLKAESLHNDNLLLTGRVVALSELLNKLKEDFEGERQKLQSRIRELELKNLQLLTEKQKHIVEIDQLKADIEDLKFSKSDFERQLSNLIYHTEQLHDEKLQYQQQISQLKHDFRKLVSDKERFDHIMKTLNSEMAEITEENSKYQMELRRLRDDIIQLRSEMDDASSFDEWQKLSCESQELRQDRYPVLQKFVADSPQTSTIHELDAGEVNKTVECIDVSRHDSHASQRKQQRRPHDGPWLANIDSSLLKVAKDQIDISNNSGESYAVRGEYKQADTQQNYGSENSVHQSDKNQKLEIHSSRPDRLGDNYNRNEPKVTDLTSHTDEIDPSTIQREDSRTGAGIEVGIEMENDNMLSARSEGMSHSDYGLAISLDSTADSGVLSWQPSPDSLRYTGAIQASEKEELKRELSGLRQQNSSLSIKVQQRDVELSKLRCFITSTNREVKRLKNSEVSLLDCSIDTLRHDVKPLNEIPLQPSINEDMKHECAQSLKQLETDKFTSDLQYALSNLESNAKFTEYIFKFPGQYNNSGSKDLSSHSVHPVELVPRTLEMSSERGSLRQDENLSDSVSDKLISADIGQTESVLSGVDIAFSSDSHSIAVAGGASSQALHQSNAAVQLNTKHIKTKFEEREMRYNQTIDAYRSHLLAAIHGCLDEEVKENLLSIVRLSLTTCH